MQSTWSNSVSNIPDNNAASLLTHSIAFPYARAIELGFDPHLALWLHRGVDILLTRIPSSCVVPNYASCFEHREHMQKELDRIVGAIDVQEVPNRPYITHPLGLLKSLQLFY